MGSILGTGGSPLHIYAPTVLRVDCKLVATQTKSTSMSDDSPQQKRVLFIEDDQSLATSLQTHLEHSGYSCDLASSAEMGFDMIAQHPYDLLLIDIMLPGNTGDQLLERVRVELHNTVPAIMLTNIDPDDTLLQRITDLHASYYLIKAEQSLRDILSKIETLV